MPVKREPSPKIKAAWRRTCPLDDYPCNIEVLDEHEGAIGYCRHGSWRTDVQKAPCVEEKPISYPLPSNGNNHTYRKKKNTKPKSNKKSNNTSKLKSK